MPALFSPYIYISTKIEELLLGIVAVLSKSVFMFLDQGTLFPCLSMQHSLWWGILLNLLFPRECTRLEKHVGGQTRVLSTWSWLPGVMSSFVQCLTPTVECLGKTLNRPSRVKCLVTWQPECSPLVRLFCWFSFYILRILNQNGVSRLYNMLEIYHSAPEPSNFVLEVVWQFLFVWYLCSFFTVCWNVVVVHQVCLNGMNYRHKHCSRTVCC